MRGLIVDNFAGGGGASAGIEAALGRPIDFAINHDAEAIAMHRANHPATHHLQTSVWDVNPRRLVRGRSVDLGWFSPDCTFHSKARGGKPFRERDTARRRRGLAWLIPYWMKAVRPSVVMLENVPEFADWGPLLKDGRICNRRRGSTFRRWVAQIENLGYSVDMRELRASEYGAPTTRKRLFVIARCDGLPIVFPEATHGAGLAPFRTAAECIDFTLPCPSIFTRARPLAPATMRRIWRGIHRYVIDSPNPFIVPNTHARLAQNVAGQSGSTRTYGGTESARPMKAVARGVNPKAVSGWQDGPGSHSTRDHARQQAGVRLDRKFQKPEVNRPPRSKQNASMSEAISSDVVLMRNARSVWQFPTEGFSAAHFATFPRELPRRCILAGSRPGDVVFDPFMGSGTVAEVALSLGRHFIGAELNAEYAAMFKRHRSQQRGLGL